MLAAVTLKSLMLIDFCCHSFGSELMTFELRCKGCHLEVGPAEFHPPRVRRDSTKWYLGDFCHGASLVWIYNDIYVICPNEASSMNWLIKAHRRVAVIDADLYTTWEVKTLLIATSWSSVPSPVRHSAEGRRCLIRSLTERFQSLHSLHFTSYVVLFINIPAFGGFCRFLYTLSCLLCQVAPQMNRLQKQFGCNLWTQQQKQRLWTHPILPRCSDNSGGSALGCNWRRPQLV